VFSALEVKKEDATRILPTIHIQCFGSHGPNFRNIGDWQGKYRRKEINQLDSFSSSVARGKTTPKLATISLHGAVPEVPHMPISQVQNILTHERQKALGPGTNSDQIANVLRTILKNDELKKSILFPLSEEDFPESGEEWQIIMASKSLLDAGAKHAKEVVGMDARWKNTDLRRPLTVLTGACKGRSAFPSIIEKSHYRN